MNMNIADKSPQELYEYARDVLKARWDDTEAEHIIMQDPCIAFFYACDVIKGRWPEAEPIIIQDAYWAYSYIIDIIRGRWPQGEPILMSDGPDSRPFYRASYIDLVLNHFDITDKQRTIFQLKYSEIIRESYRYVSNMNMNNE